MESKVKELIKFFEDKMVLIPKEKLDTSNTFYQELLNQIDMCLTKKTF